jgi:signal transduction histidine kinase
LFNREEISPDLLKLLNKNQMTVLNKEEITIYDTQNKVVFEAGSNKSKVKAGVLGQVRLQKEYFWEQEDLEMFGLVFKNNNKDYIVIASAIDKYGLSKQRNLAWILALGGLLMVLMSAVIGWFFAGRVLLPIQQIIQKIDMIRASKLNLRLSEGNKTDELAQLSMRFNQMLDRLEEAFKSQRSFVSHASHELRTPLTAITGQIQVSLLANDNAADLRLMVQSILDDVKQLNKLINNLLDLMSIDTDDNNIKFRPINVAEVIGQVRTELLKKNSHYEILIALDENPDLLPEIKANESLIYTALINLIDNGAKFAPDHRVSVCMTIQKNDLIITVHNNGSVILPDEMTQIFEPFRRGSNAQHVKGHGVGLSLTKRIMALHNGQLSVESSPESGTTFTARLPK